MSRIFERLHSVMQEHEADQELGLPQQRGYNASTTEPGSAPILRTNPSALQFGNVSREAIGKLVHQLFFVKRPPRIVVFSAVERNVGCTFLAARTAEILAEQSNASVCLVDGNVRYPALHEVFKIDNERGLRDVMITGDCSRSCAKRLPDTNLWVLPSGRTCDGEYALRGSAIRNWTRQMRSEFTYIIVDTAPLNLYNDALGLASSSEGLVLVLKANSSHRETAQNILQELRTADVRLLGAILNQRTFPVPEAIYSKL
jgi:protein-tyrosine kinase